MITTFGESLFSASVSVKSRPRRRRTPIASNHPGVTAVNNPLAPGSGSVRIGLGHHRFIQPHDAPGIGNVAIGQHRGQGSGPHPGQRAHPMHRRKHRPPRRLLIFPAQGEVHLRRDGALAIEPRIQVRPP